MMEMIPYHISSVTSDLYKIQHYIHPQMFRMFPLELPVPTKLIRKIVSGVFVEMAELLAEWLGILCTNDTKQKPKKRSLLILKWLLCYAVYVAVVMKK